ncbi:MAG: Vms1/Ankzf1 family peptidyl-tRNA hydrolase [candidate division WOR-3 bacterium]|nr:Vms1/Ankzf1 family peptidyl-tRNA hydrolase [candidate division WOR-3 bacterium]
MKLSEEIITELAHLSETKRTVLSVYLDMRNGWDAVKHFIDKESARLLPLLNKEEKDYFETSISFLFDFFKRKKQEKIHSPGLAFFADLGANLIREVELNHSPEPLLAVDEGPIIHPLALQLEKFEPVGVIMIDAACARILIVAGQVLEDMDGMCKKIHHLTKAGGWSQMRYQRRRDKQIHHFAKEIMAEAIEIFKESNIKRIIIAGRDRMITALEQEFPKDWENKVIAKVPWDLDASDNDFLQKIRPILEQTERNHEQNMLDKLVAELKRNGLAVNGLEPTSQALARGQVDAILLSEALDAETAEKLTTRAKATGAYIEFIPKENEVLAKLGNVGAILRYKTKS